MGIYINMEMPTSCLDCPMNYDSIDCKANPNISLRDQWYEFLFDVKRHKDCPLVPVPPHGRLIDADALRAKQQEDADLFQGSTAYCDKCRRDEAMNAVANIVNAPTIIPAEEGE